MRDNPDHAHPDHLPGFVARVGRPPDPTSGDASSPEEVGRRLHSYLTQSEEAYPGLWRELVLRRERHTRGPATCPEWCWCPTDDVTDIVVGRIRGIQRHGRLGIEAIPWGLVTPAVLAALGRWRLGKAILRFDDELAGALDDTTGLETAPLQSLTRLPAWAVYVVDDFEWRPGGRVRGWFASATYSPTTRCSELELLFDIVDEDGHGFQLIRLNLAAASLDDAIRHVVTETVAAMPDDLVATLRHTRHSLADVLTAEVSGALRHCVSRLLYITSETPDLSAPDGKVLAPATPGHGRKPWVAADRVREWGVGYRIGSRLRSARTRAEHGDGTTGRTMRPHVRRAHWHTYRVGPGRTQRRVIWMAPFLVGAADDDHLPMVERPVA